jgi:predicted metalloprotease with PDZ domain
MLKYLVSVADPKGHYFDVQLQVEIPVSALQTNLHKHWIDLVLPVWIPGSYLVREFSKHILGVSVRVNDFDTLCIQENKNSWRIWIDQDCLKADSASVLVHAKWRVYAWDLSVRGAHLDETHGFFNGTSLFLYPKTCEAFPVELEILKPKEHKEEWLVACGLPYLEGTLKDPHGCAVLKAGSSVKLSASNYDALIDHPVEMGQLRVNSFMACGVKHVLAVYGADRDLDLERICRDLKPICETQIKLFEPQTTQAPFNNYFFILHATHDGYGGLEHRNSTALLCKASDLPQQGVNKAPKGYETFLGLCSHEYFHAWNVKRIKPAAFVPYDLNQENYTRLLWVFEGFTSYYDDLILVRTGAINEENYLKLLCKTIAKVIKEPGRLIQSVAESSLTAWTKYYRQDENAPNSIVSYYAKGALVALCLDSAIRLQTHGKKSLDDVMRLMWKQHGLTGKGVPENSMPDLIQEATGLDLKKEIEQWTQSTEELPLREALQVFGYSLQQKQEENSIDLGINEEFKPEGMLVKQVLNGSPAYQAGISAKDILIALEDKQLTETHYKRVLTASQPGSTLSIWGFRAERLIEFKLIASKAEPSEWEIKKLSTSSSNIIRSPWSGSAIKGASRKQIN